MICEPGFLAGSDSRRIFIVTQGSLKTARYTFVFVNGLGGAVNMWMYLISSLLKHVPDARCITYEHRGHAASTHHFPANAHSLIDVLADDLFALCTELRVQHPMLVGHSMGCLVIERCLERHPELRAHTAMMISAPYHLPVLPHWMSPVLYRTLHTCSQMFPRREPPLSLQLPEYYRASRDFSLRRVWFEVRTLGFVPFVLAWMSLLSEKKCSLKVLAELKQTPFFVYGKQDAIVPLRVTSYINQQLPDARVIELEANHCMVPNMPEELATVLYWATGKH